jgi:flagellar basal body-associated protein FliL
MMHSNLKMACEELEKKDLMLRDKLLNNFSVPRTGSIRLDPAVLEDQVRKLRDALSAHQSHNAFLGAEIRRYESEYSKMQAAQSNTILTLQKQLDELRNDNHKLKLRDAFLTDRVRTFSSSSSF